MVKIRRCVIRTLRGYPAPHRTMVPSHFNGPPANVPTRAVQGRRRSARTRRRSSIPTTSRALATFSGGGSWAEPLWETAHRRIGFGSPPALFRRWEGTPIAELCVGDPEPFPNVMHRVWGPFPTEAVRFRAFPSGFRPPPLVPGLFWFRARVILLTDGPTRPTLRLLVSGKVPTFPHPEPPLLLVLLRDTHPTWLPKFGNLPTGTRKALNASVPAAELAPSAVRLFLVISVSRSASLRAGFGAR